MVRDRITVQEAARRLGVKDDAIRKRIQRGTLEHDKGPDGRVFVYLDATHDAAEDSYQDSTRYQSHDSSNGSSHDASYAVLVELLRSELEEWKQVVATRDEELRRKDSIIMQMAQANASLAARVPELEASVELRDGPENASDTTEGTDTPTDQGYRETGVQRRSWWRRFFGFEVG